ncbi:MAG TPA: YbhB/YbcL family Raf kinase inhibitor-like protein [Candidatus Angelobacter sp.]
MFQLTSSAFSAGADIPRRFTCQGDDDSPELTWKNAPKATKSFALIVNDPDAPRAGGFTHWVVYNLPATVNHLERAYYRYIKSAPLGVQGRNDFGELGYRGPCPPSGTHRYYFYLYALDAELNLKPDLTKDELEVTIKGHVLEKAELMGKYKKN